MYRARISCLLVFATLTLIGALVERQAYAGGGNVMPPAAKPHGYTLADMAEQLALFSTSFNNPMYKPDTPFQILYFDPNTFAINLVGDTLVESGSNTFPVNEGTMFFVPLFGVDDSPPIIGSFPTSSGSDAQVYIFDDAQVGADSVQIEVDGLVTSIGQEYVAGPVVTPPLLDGGGTHIIQVGAFLTPFSPGTHNVTIRGNFDGKAYVAAVGNPLSFEFTYTVIVE
jgi:hypothetical protein